MPIWPGQGLIWLLFEGLVAGIQGETRILTEGHFPMPET